MAYLEIWWPGYIKYNWFTPKLEHHYKNIDIKKLQYVILLLLEYNLIFKIYIEIFNYLIISSKDDLNNRNL